MTTSAAVFDASAHPLRVLLIEDCAEDAVSVSRSLERSGQPRCSLQVSPTWEEGRRALEIELPDIVLLDLHLPDAEGLSLVRSAIDAAPHVPLVILTGSEEDQVAHDALHLGAQDYLVKSDLGTNALGRSIRHAIERHRILESAASSHRERLELKNQLLSHVSHELLTPLSAMYQFIDILGNTLGRQGPDALKQQRKCIEVLGRNAVQLRRMIGDLLEATRIESGKLQLDVMVVDSRRCLDTAARSAEPEAERRKVALQVELPEDLPLVLGDETRIGQVIGNLLSNAIKFTPAGGRITVSSRRSPDDPGTLQVTVADTGKGIRSDALPLIFDRLYQDRESVTGSRKGLGLGLYISKEVIQQLGGRIWVESELGAGSQFHFTLPLHSTERALAGRIPAEGALSLVVVSVSAADSGVAMVPSDELSSEVQLALPRLVWNQCDVVLPRQRALGRDLMAVVAQTDPSGASAMRGRLERVIGELRSGLGDDSPLAVSAHALRTAGESGTTPAAVASRVDAVLQALAGA